MDTAGRPSLAEALAFALPDMAAEVVRVPEDIAAEVGRVTGAELGDVPVFRGSAVDRAAGERGARAFAKDGAVFLPESAGAVNSGRARALIAHELVHVAQQRRVGRVPDGEVGRRMEAEAVAVERRYESTAVGRAELRHPVRRLELAGPAQLAPVAPPEPARSHFEEPAREEIVRLAESSAHRVVEEWTRPEPGRAGGFRSAAPGPDRASRRQELEAEMLEEINADRLEAGEPLLSGLEPEHVERLENRLDREEITGERRRTGRSAPGRQTPPLVGGAFGDTVSFTETVGGAEAPRGGPRIGAHRAAVNQLGLAAALSAQQTQAQQNQAQQTQAQQNHAAQSQRAKAEELLPAVEGGAFGDTVSFTERRGDDRYQGGKPPAPAKDMHGSEQEPLDLDRLDLEELTNRLYDRLRGRLRLELLVDRERAGILTDFR
ncbi:DUF4157 domain-containing protein [Actinokineospora guangxiensis]|uniref:DUF4157 domain-containing protein n=1 Tax=Actinokineospora guangxiensis TaxID=1490288 RepID=A0ABW0EW94_9PSEU